MLAEHAEDPAQSTEQQARHHQLLAQPHNRCDQMVKLILNGGDCAGAKDTIECQKAQLAW